MAPITSACGKLGELVTTSRYFLSLHHLTTINSHDSDSSMSDIEGFISNGSIMHAD